MESAPLFEEERHASSRTLVANRERPFAFHGSGTSSTLTANNDPVNASQFEAPQILQQRFDGKETHRRRRRLQLWDSRQTVSLVLDADAPPNMLGGSCESQPSREELCHSPRTLREYLISMPVRLDHHACYCLDVVIRDSLMKEVAHRVHKYHLGCSPTEWFAQFFGNKTQIKSLLVRM